MSSHVFTCLCLRYIMGEIAVFSPKLFTKIKLFLLNCFYYNYVWVPVHVGIHHLKIRINLIL